MNGVTVTGETITVSGVGDNAATFSGALQTDTNATATWARIWACVHGAIRAAG